MPSVPGLDWLDELMAVCTKGLARDLAELADERTEVTVLEIDGTHAMVLENPEAVADAILRFAAGL